MTWLACLTNMFSEKKKAAQPEFWVVAQQVPKSPKATFYSNLDETLEGFGFAEKVRQICAPAYKQTNVGRPGIDPVVYLKMIMVGFFEDLPSERAIAARCADSMSIRAFLNYELDEKTPDHSSFTVIRQRLGLDLYERIFTLSLQALREHGLLRGKNLGIDSSVIEANASLRALVHRNTEEQYWDYVKRLAAESGIGMHIERSFAHILDCGGMRRTTLRGWENLNKRFKLAAAFYNLSQLMRKLFGIGTPKQLAACGWLLLLQLTYLLAVIAGIVHRNSSARIHSGMDFAKFLQSRQINGWKTLRRIPCCSTG
jgi:transposase